MKNNNIGVILSLIGAWMMLILLFWTIIFLVVEIINIRFLMEIKNGNNDKLVPASILSIIFGGIFGIIGGIIMLVQK